MKDFQFYVTDDRYGVRSLVLIQTRDAERAHFLARRMLAEKHHHAVEVWADNKRLFTVEETAPTQAA